MSQHFVERGGLPPGLSSFTKIRLGWISKEQVLIVKPGDTAVAFLSPLSVGGDKLVVKIPLSWGKYYLIESRQPMGFDRALPDAGMLVLKVDPNVAEGYGTVRIMDANPNSAHFRQATFRPDEGMRYSFVEDNVAVIPLWRDGDKLGVLVTTRDKCAEALEAARAVAGLMKRGGAQDQVATQAKDAFLAFDFQRCIGLAGR
jgi:hypothetical protein